MAKSVTLETLHDEFAKLQRQRLGDRYVDQSSSISVIRDWTREDGFADGEDPILTAKMQDAARLYIKALDEGLEAAMLWKLSRSA